MIPNVNSAAQAQCVVASTRYPPAGARVFAGRHRGNCFGRLTGYAATAPQEQLLAVQIENAEAVENAAAIAATGGVDVLFVGPNDLAASIGHVGNPAEAGVERLILRVLGAARHSRVRPEGGCTCRAAVKAHKPAGIWSGDAVSARRYIDMGFTMVAIGSDLSLLVSSADTLVREFLRSTA
jgi:2-keto-3-deoxy-L-rhamnonate aldolase RhmA